LLGAAVPCVSPTLLQKKNRGACIGGKRLSVHTPRLLKNNFNIFLILERGRAIANVIQKNMDSKSFPAVFVNGSYFGDVYDVIQAEADGRLEVIAGAVTRTYDFDLFVIGGGSAGLAAAKVNL